VSGVLGAFQGLYFAIRRKASSDGPLLLAGVKVGELVAMSILAEG